MTGPLPRLAGGILAGTALLGLMGIAGAVEGRADTGPAARALLAQETAIFRSMPARERDRYCGAFRGWAEYQWLDGMAESVSWKVPPRRQEWAAHTMLLTECGPRP